MNGEGGYAPWLYRYYFVLLSIRLTPLIALEKLAFRSHCVPVRPIMAQSAPSVPPDRFERFADFYPYYLEEHRHPTCRRLHVVGTSLALAGLMTALFTRNWMWLLAAIVIGYAFAWVGHFGFEKNRPATFRHPWYSLLGDFALLRDVLLRRLKF
jgi:hypothetical protein